MTATWLLADQVFDGARLLASHAVKVVDGRVAAVVPSGDVPTGATVQKAKGVITPGYVDLQVNGGGGVLLNKTPTPDGIAQIAAAHRQFGTVAIMPTVITDTFEVIAAAAEAAIAAHGTRGIVGLHIEGPHIAPSRRGTHDAGFVRPMNDATLDLVRKLRAAGVAVKLTLAPEAVTTDQIAAVVAMGAIVSLGHTDADAESVRAALAAGASCFTHLYNAMSPMLNRSPGVVGAAINSDAYCGIICDGHHVADEMVGLAIRARPVADRMFLVSDAMPTVGGPDHFRLYGQDIHLEDGRLINAEGSLAGAHVTQAQGVQRLMRHVGLTPEAALRMAITVPATLVGQPQLAQIVGRDVTDILMLDAEFAVVGTLDTLCPTENHANA